MGTPKTRKIKIDKMRTIVKKATDEGNYINKKQLAASFALHENMTLRSARELVQTFIDAEEFKEGEGGVYYGRL